MSDDIIIISVGGSLIIPKPESVDVEFLKNFRALILRKIEEGKRFVLVTGGGKVCRMYNETAEKITTPKSDDLDWMGIRATHLNAELVRVIFGDLAYKSIISDPTVQIPFTEKILVAGGWKPGFSSDHDAVLLAKNFGAKKVVNLSNIDMVYDKDPRQFPDVKPIKDITWQEFRKLLPSEWKPGLNAPFDPIAAKEAEELGLEVAVMNGKDLSNLESYLQGKAFLGTHIHA